MKNCIFLLTLAIAPDKRDQIEALLASDAPWGWEEKDRDDGAIVFGVYSEQRHALEDIAREAGQLCPYLEAAIEEVKKRDWQFAWREFFTPVEVGSRFVILPPWLAHLSHTSRREIIIEPRTAFGTGHHASTRLCLLALNNLLESGRIRKGDWFLDLGCGTGVLGIAAAKSGLNGTGLDIDPVAIANSRENRELNDAESLELLAGSLEKVKGEKYDLVMANILSQPLIDMAPQLTAAMKKDGCLVLGGILDSQGDAVADAYRACGLGDPSLLADGEWIALVWEAGRDRTR